MPLDELKIQRGLGDAGEALDPQARDEYRRRRDELRAELADAQSHNDLGRVDAARHEIVRLLTDELTAVVRARQPCPKKVCAWRARAFATGDEAHPRAALDLIRRNVAELADHLDRSIRTGAFCGYLPGADEKIAWQL